MNIFKVTLAQGNNIGIVDRLIYQGKTTQADENTKKEIANQHLYDFEGRWVEFSVKDTAILGRGIYQ